MQRHVLRTLYAIHLTFGNSRSDGFSASGRGRQGAVQTRAAEQELPRSANRKVMKCGIAVSMKFTQQRHRVFQPLTSDSVRTADCSIAAPVVCCTTRQRRGSNREPRACPPSPLSFGASASPGPGLPMLCRGSEIVPPHRLLANSLRGWKLGSLRRATPPQVWPQ